MANTRGKGVTSPSQGPRGNCYKGGLTKTDKKRRSTPEMMKDEESYLNTLSKPLLSATAKYLCLTSKVRLTNHYKSQIRLREMIKSYWKDPKGYRIEDKLLCDNGKKNRSGCQYDLFEQDPELMRYGEESYNP